MSGPMGDMFGALSDLFGGERPDVATIANLYRRGWRTAPDCFRGCVVHERTAGFALPVARAMALEFGGAK